MTPRIGSLCTGYGGLDMAVQQVFGGTVAWHSQYEPPDKNGREDKNQYAAQILTHHWPKIPNHGDLTAIDFHQVEPVDILTAGFPCQDVSLAGRRAGLAEGTRSGLWLHVARAIEELQPRLVVIENVPGLLSAPADSDVEPCTWCVGDAGDEPLLRALGAVLADLARLGLDAEWGVLGASDVGAPHQRRRVILLAWPADPSRAGLARGRAEGTAPDRRGLAAADAHGVGGERDRARGRRRYEPAAHDFPAADSAGVGEREPADEAHTVAGSGHARKVPGGRGGTPASHARRIGRRAAEHDVQPGEPDAGRGTAADTDSGGLQGDEEPPAGRVAVRQRVRDHTDGRDDLVVDAQGDGRDEGRPEPAGQQRGSDAPVSSAQGVDWGEYEPAIRRWEHVLGRPAPRPTDALGRLAPAFVEWMQGLPAGHITGVPGLPRGAQLKALGNGVVPQQAAAALRLLTGRVETVLGVAS
ncbi:DNA cytosine methyltransferase [Streptomyces ipomoeae]|uniref:DNA cytosine methyltransferase n=1 Tax=Streptomyces ipomoeae TaxID=103232 RepID=UPI0029BA9D22|nr:DNA cytosine methyltransferase [Streptomyces ipomoeae]MDX2696045.1 DNA cytosine methyltransferase [Streptomyces ipomoeae]